MERQASDVGGDVSVGLKGRGMFGEGETLGDEVEVHDGKGTGREEIGRDVKVAGIPCAMSESSGGEAMGWDVGEGSGEDGVFGWVEG